MVATLNAKGYNKMEITNKLESIFFWESEDPNCVLDGLHKFTYDYLDKNMDAIFKNKASWTKFGKRVDNCELTKWLEFRRKGCYVKALDCETIEVYCDSGLWISTGFFYENGTKKYIYDKFTKLKIKIDYEWSFQKNEEYATAIEIYGKIIWED